MSHSLDVCLHFSASGVLWSSPFAPPLRVPPQSLSGNITCWFEECVPNPAPSPFPDFVLNRKLVCLVPEVNVANGVRPVYSKNFFADSY